MATLAIDTTDPNYQTRLTQLQQIKAFYGPRIARYLQVQDTAKQADWEARDPILAEIMDMHRKISAREDIT